MSELHLIYGASGTSKTTTCGQFHRYEAHRNQVPGIHITQDSSISPMQEEINEGLVRVWHLGYETPQINSSLLAALHWIAQGAIPKHLHPETGQRLSNDWMPLVGSMSIEGLYMITDALKTYLTSDRKLTNSQFTELSGIEIGGTQMQVYDIIKSQINAIITRMKGLTHTKRILWTSHEGVGTDSQQATVLGPAMLPNKGLDKIPAQFAHVFHTVSIDFVNEQNQPDVGKLFYFGPHNDVKSGLPWPAKTSLPVSEYHALRLRALEASKGQLHNALLARVVNGKVVGGYTDFLQHLDRLKAEKRLEPGK